MRTQTEKGNLFRDLHQREGAFMIPNPWDIGTARLLAQLGFDALATTSAGCAFSLGLPDGSLSRAVTIEHIATIAAATELPVSADLENGFGEAPEVVAETIRLAAATGVVGASIEDATGDPKHPIFELNLATERIAAAAETARGLPFPFMLTARAENYLQGRPDLNNTIERLQAYQEAGADVLYAPGLTSAEEIVAVVRAVDRPLNVLMGLPTAPFSLADLSRFGVKRISVGSALSRTALGSFLDAARAMRQNGTFAFAKAAVPYAELQAMFALD